MDKQIAAITTPDVLAQNGIIRTIWLFGFVLFTALLVLVLVFYQQYNLLFGIGQLLIVGILSFLHPIIGTFALLFFSTTTGFWGRLALHLAGGQVFLDFIRFSLELCVLVFAFLAIRRDRFVRKSSTKTIDLFILLYLIISSLATLNILFVGPTTTIWGWRWVCLPLLMYYIGRHAGLKEYAVRGFYHLSMWLLVILSCLAIYQMEVGLLPFEWTWFYQLPDIDRLGDASSEVSRFIGGEFRVPSFMVGHYYLGFMIPFLFLTVFFMPKQDLTRPWRAFRLLTLSAGIMYIALSLERSAIGIVFIGMFVALCFKLWCRFGPITATVFVVMTLFGLSLVGNLVEMSGSSVQVRRVLELLDPFNAATVRWRVSQVWQPSLDRIISNPIGYGLGATQGTRQNRAGGAFLAPHNLYLQILLEQGIAGLFFFLMVVITYSLKLVQVNINNFQYSHTLSALTPICGFLVIGFFNIPLEFPLGLFFWFTIGLFAAHLSREKGIANA